MNTIQRRHLLALAALHFLASPRLVAAKDAAIRPADVTASWADFKTRFINAEGRVVDSYSKITHTEGQGFALLIAAHLGDKMCFEKIWGWTQRSLMRPDGLFSWKWELNKVADPNNATDGDILIAWALLRASVLFKNSEYAVQAKKIVRAIKTLCVKEIGPRTLLMPGVAGFYVEGKSNEPARLAINPSYWIFPALKLFKQLEPMGSADEKLWGRLIQSGQEICKISGGVKDLPLDWLEASETGEIKPWAQRPIRFGYEAIRVPLYLKWANMTSPAITAVSALAAPARPMPAWIGADKQVAEYAAPAGFVNIVRLLTNQPLIEDTSKDYYSSVLTLLCLISAQ